MITRIVLYLTLGLVCSLLGYSWSSWQFWTLLGLFWVSDQVGQSAGREQGYIEGIHAYLNMDREHQQNIQRLIKEIKDGSQ